MGIMSYGGAGVGLNLRGQTTNKIALPAGGIYTIPAGPFNITPGNYSCIQFRDPVSGEWRLFSTVGSAPTYIESDGTNWRIANLTGCVVGARLTNAGSAYTSIPAVAFSAGGATATAIMGQVVSTTVILTSTTAGTVGQASATSGANYTLPPICVVSPPAAGGFPATATATITGGAVSSVTITDQGAGYGMGPASVAATVTNLPTITFLPNPEDTNLNSQTNAIVAATATLSLDPASAGTVTGILVTNPGTPQTAVPTISFTGGGGSAAAATAVMCLTVTAQTVSGGTGFGAVNLYTTAGGFLTAATAYVTTQNPFGVVRPAQGTAAASAGALTTVAIDDGGIFQAVPTGIVVGSALITASPTISTPTVGGVTDNITIQGV